jgi:hypothetical protein
MAQGAALTQPGTPVERAQLGTLTELASGGQAVIHLAPEFSLPGVTGPLVYKEYLPEVGAVSRVGLNTLIGFPDSLEPHNRDWLHTVTLWPRAVVVDDDHVCGVLMQLIPDDFMQRMQLTRSVDTETRKTEFLFVDRAATERAGVQYASEKERLTVCAHLAFLIAFLHKRDMMFGDISGSNVTFRQAPQIGVMLVDCDGVRRVGSAAIVKQLHTPYWIPPEGEEAAQTKETDRYKLALFILRALTPGPGASVSTDPDRLNGRVDKHAMELFKLALTGASVDRPHAKDWFEYVKHALKRA